MECVYPWYTWDDGEPYSDYVTIVTSCTDHSDQIFEVNQTCGQHLQGHLDFHNESFCNENYPDVNSSLICTDISQWLSEQDSPLSDPYNCQSSCAEPDPDCLACTNSSYFLCDQSGQCIHPSLVCDGHPQCDDGSDENLDMTWNNINCHEKYIKNRIVEPYASMRCKSPFYNMTIYATPCDGKKECREGVDEDNCQNNSKTNLVLFPSSCLIHCVDCVLLPH